MTRFLENIRELDRHDADDRVMPSVPQVPDCDPNDSGPRVADEAVGSALKMGFNETTFVLVCMYIFSCLTQDKIANGRSSLIRIDQSHAVRARQCLTVLLADIADVPSGLVNPPPPFP